MSVINNILAKYLRLRMKRINDYIEKPEAIQRQRLEQLIRHARNTEWGKKHGYKDIKTAKQFREAVPIQDYESLKPFIQRMMLGEKNVLWHGAIRWFSKSSGTTSDKSKYIPVSWEHHRQCLMRGCWDTLSVYYDQNPNANLFKGKGIVMGGTWDHYGAYPKTKRGDVSALMLNNMPAIGKYFYTPDMETALMSEWEEKIEKMATITAQENVTNLGGVPTWTIVLFRRLLELQNKDNIHQIWPNLELYIHGGVSFTPYKEQFKQFLPDDKMTFLEIYNASEGYFAVQNDLTSDDMLLLLDNGIYYEFIPSSEWHSENPKAISINEVELNTNYAIVISTNSGLWRYVPGDTIKFTSKYPFKIKITGRTKHYINAFGEEVMIENTDKAIFETCKETNAIVKEYTVAPIYIQGKNKGGHEWLIEFEQHPENIERFAYILDENLQKINSDYEAKRYKNLALEQLIVRPMPQNTFYNWLKNKGKYGGQSKIPRLSNQRVIAEEILKYVGL